MKGWELYRWKDAACSDKKGAVGDCYALLIGTNRNKSPEEIKKSPLRRDALKQKLATLKAGELVSWSAPSAEFSVPTPSRSDEPIVEEAKRLGLKLEVASSVAVDTTCRAKTTELAEWLKKAEAKPDENRPVASSIRKDLDALERPTAASQKAPQLATGRDLTIETKAFGECRPVHDLLSSFASLAPMEKRRRLIAELPGKVEACGCQIDMPAAKDLAWTWLKSWGR